MALEDVLRVNPDKILIAAKADLPHEGYLRLMDRLGEIPTPGNLFVIDDVYAGGDSVLATGMAYIAQRGVCNFGSVDDPSSLPIFLLALGLTQSPPKYGIDIHVLISDPGDFAEAPLRGAQLVYDRLLSTLREYGVTQLEPMI